MRPPVETLAGRYRLLTQLGKGGMGSVWQGEHVSLGTEVAIKLLDPHLAQRESVRARFVREARAAATLKSKHVVKILDHGVEGEIPFIIMELLHGESLGARLARDKKIVAEDLARIFVETGKAVARAHAAGIVHRDLKPDNIFLAKPEDEPGPFIVKVVDFGIAKALQGSELEHDVSTDTGAMLGTPHYMSPEQARGHKVDARCDLWSMAIIAFQCVTGRRPFVADALGELVLLICAEAAPMPSSVAPVPPGFDAWFARATRRSIDERFQTVGELVRGLEEVLTPGSVTFDASVPGANDSNPTAAVTSPGASGDDSTIMANADASPTHEPATKSVTPAPPRSSRAPLFAALAIVLLGTGGLGVYAARGYGAGRSSGSGPPPVETPAAASQSAPPSTAVPTSNMSPPASATSQGPPSSPPPKEIVVTIRATPSGAAVFRGNERLGDANAPITLPWSESPFKLEVRRAGYLSKPVSVTPAASVEVEVTLQPAKPSETPF